jgi:succinate dehydrogenase/fumarate reductase flavoprotein subunit
VDRKGMLLPRITLVFTVGGPQIQQDLLNEFSLHHDVVATGDERNDAYLLRVETSDAAGAVWEVRATIGMFDDNATEITTDRSDQP